MKRIPTLVYVTDRATAPRPLPEMAVLAIRGGADVVQIREKDLAESALEQLAEAILDRVGDRERIAVNGNEGVATRLSVGLHLPEAMPFAGGIAEEHMVSRSVHTPRRAADAGDVDYLIAGHVFETASKPGRDPIGLQGLAAIAAAADAPVLAIGGVTPAGVAALIDNGASGVAVLSGINTAADPEAAAYAYRQALERVMQHSSSAVPVTINGKPATITPGISIDAFLRERDLHERMVVVELNGVIIRRAGFPSTQLNAGDKIEIVHFVGGG